MRDGAGEVSEPGRQYYPECQGSVPARTIQKLLKYVVKTICMFFSLTLPIALMKAMT